MSDLLRRAGFGANPDELDSYLEQGYEATVEQLFKSEDSPSLDGQDLIRRYHIDQNSLMLIESSQAYWLYRMINTKRPLEEKIALFWHGHFATNEDKVRDYRKMLQQLQLFQAEGLGNFRTLMVGVARDPAMLTFLDAGVNVKGSPNENFAREIMELFTMGVGHYTETDIRE